MSDVKLLLNSSEIPFLFKEVKELIAVDISYAMLEEVKKKNSYINIVHNPAEKLDNIDTNSIDLYISLRTYQSSLFDIGRLPIFINYFRELKVCCFLDIKALLHLLLLIEMEWFQ